jgi:hypothetical protein
MKDELRNLLTPADDGRPFTEAVMLRAAGALARRRAAAEQTATPWAWLERWARPWLVAVLVVLAVAALVPAAPQPRTPQVAAGDTATNDEMAALVPDEMAASALREGR